MRFKSIVLAGIAMFAFADSNETKIFMDKYLPKERQEAAIGGFSPSDLQKKADMRVSDFNKNFETNETKFKKDYGLDVAKLGEDSASKELARKVNEYIRSQAYQRNIEEAKAYILKDKAFGYKTGQISGEWQKYKIGNRYLSQKEKLYIVISSSIPKNTLRRYVRDVQKINTDVTFVMRGVVGSLKKIKPTMDFIQSILVKDDSKPISRKNMYQANVEINPKVVMRYGITKTPAIVYVDDYDPSIEMNKPLPTGELKEKVYVVYGDVSLRYALEKIAQKHETEGLKRLLKAMKGGYFDR